jgi:hypothetical protein
VHSVSRCSKSTVPVRSPPVASHFPPCACFSLAQLTGGVRKFFWRQAPWPCSWYSVAPVHPDSDAICTSALQLAA